MCTHICCQFQMAEVELTPDSVFELIVKLFKGSVYHRHLFKHFPDEIRVVQWLRKRPDRFLIFEDDGGRPTMVSVRMPGAALCPQYSTTGLCREAGCHRFHICRDQVGGHCGGRLLCLLNHDFQVLKDTHKHTGDDMKHTCFDLCLSL